MGKAPGERTEAGSQLPARGRCRCCGKEGDVWGAATRSCSCCMGCSLIWHRQLCHSLGTVTIPAWAHSLLLLEEPGDVPGMGTLQAWGTWCRSNPRCSKAASHFTAHYISPRRSGPRCLIRLPPVLWLLGVCARWQLLSHAQGLAGSCRPGSEGPHSKAGIFLSFKLAVLPLMELCQTSGLFNPFSVPIPW